MKTKSTLRRFVAISVFASALAKDDAEDTKAVAVDSVDNLVIPKLTEADFESKTSQGLHFINFYSPRCVHCKMFEPTWKKLAFDLRAETKNGLHFDQVDCDTDIHLCLKEKIYGTPTMKLYSEGKYESSYEADRDEETIMDFLKKHQALWQAYKAQQTIGVDESDEKLKPLRNLIDKSTSKDEVNEDGKVVDISPFNWETTVKFGPWVLEFTTGDCEGCEQFSQKMKDMARALKGHANVGRVDMSKHPEMAAGIKNYPTTVFYRNGGRIVEYEGDISLGAMIDFGKRVGKFELEYIKDPHHFKELSEKEPVFSLLLFDKDSPELAVRTFAKAAEDTYFHVPAYVSENYNVLPSIKRPCVLLLRKDDPWSPHMYEDDINSHFDMGDFINKRRYGFVQSVTPFNVDDLLKSSETLIVGILNPVRHKNEMKALHSVSKELRARFMEFGEMHEWNQLDVEDSERHNELRDPEDKNIKVVYFNTYHWHTYLTKFLNVAQNGLTQYGRAPSVKVPSVVVVMPKAGIYYDADEEGKPFQFAARSIMIRLGNLRKELEAGKESGLTPKYLKGDFGESSSSSGISSWTLFLLAGAAAVLYFLIRKYATAHGFKMGQYKPNQRAPGKADVMRVVRGSGKFE